MLLMKRLSVREFRTDLAAALHGDEPVLLTRHGRALAVVYPLARPERVPLEVRRSIVESVSRDLATHPRWPSSSPVIEQYKRDVDRTLIRENLQRTPEERLQALQALQKFASELRRAR
jgi:antitoxin (DNA-binding transcriptional repressor) of toxin-antitoxin stability system